MENEKVENKENIEITDAHIHVDPYQGDGPLHVAKTFYNAGGRIMIIPNKPAWTTPEPYNYEKNMEKTLKYIKTINKETEVKAYGFLGVHPAEYSNLIRNGETYEKAYLRVEKALNYGLELIKENKELIGIGEIGRPHYPVEDEELKYQNKIFKHCLNMGKDNGLPVMLHTEDLTREKYMKISKYCEKIKLEKYHVIKHHASNEVLESENYGLTTSLTSNKVNISEALDKKVEPNFLMETDYFDEKKHPGMVLGPKTVPKRTLQYIDNGQMTLEQAITIHEKVRRKVLKI